MPGSELLFVPPKHGNLAIFSRLLLWVATPPDFRLVDTLLAAYFPGVNSG